MQIQTSRFGAIQTRVSDLFVFPSGLIGFEDFRRWVLLADTENEAVGRPVGEALPQLGPIVAAALRDNRSESRGQIVISRAGH